jgi:hypothetical protein
MATRTSKGTCGYCGGVFGKGAMSRHLTACRRRPAPGPKAGKGYHLVVAGRYQPDYWLHLEVPAGARLTDLDDFLRRTWLECCGHLSAFTIDGVEYTAETGGVDAMWAGFFGRPRARRMDVRVDKVLRPGTHFFHEYDFGTTTHLALRVLAEHDWTGERSVRVLARNVPPEIPCGACGRPGAVAAYVCSQCSYEDEGWLCRECARVHGCDEEMLLPVVNSPRVGQCGYTGESEA